MTAPDAMTPTGVSIIGGVSQAGRGDEWRAVNPATGTAIGPVYRDADVGAIAIAVDAARRAFGTGAPDPALIVEVLRQVATIAETYGARLVETAASETGLTAARLEGELARTCGQFRFLADVAESGARLDPTIDRAADGQPDVRRVNVAIGPVAVFGASNFPLAFGVLGGDTAAALAAGCPAVVKGHPAHPATSEMSGRILAAAVETVGLDPGWTSMLSGGRDVGIHLVRAPEIRAVAFTGSRRAGRALYDVAAQRPDPIPVFAELGSLNPCFVTAAAGAARADEIAHGLAESVSGSSGQLCTKPGVVFAPSAALDALAAPLVDALATPGVPLLTASEQAGLAHQLDDATARAGVDVLGPGPRATGTGNGFVGTVLRCSLATFASTPSLREELFGPVCVFVECDDAAFTLAIASLDAALVGTIHAEPEDDPTVAAVLAALVPRVGRVVLNGVPTGLRIVHAMHHGGPWPATTNAQVTSVGGAALDRFLRPVAFQSVPDALLPASLQAANPRGLTRRIDGVVVAPDR